MRTGTIGKTRVDVLKGDITELDTQAVVNAANDQLILGGGVAGAIRNKGGPSIQEQCDRVGGTTVGQAVVTGGGDLKAEYVIHAVGPRQGEGDEDDKLAAATVNSLKRAEEHQVESVAFPAVSTGVFGFPVDRAAQVMIGAAKDYLAGGSEIKRVVFCLFDQESYDLFAAELGRQLG
jgi:O-acetyl-ADP-ribose deacetylase (regulator of RNase III)